MNATQSLSEPLLEVRGLNGWYGAAQILRDIALNVGPGEVVALMGRNGAGKSTTLKAIAGLLARSSGEVRCMGQHIRGWPAYRNARLGLGDAGADGLGRVDQFDQQRVAQLRPPPSHVA